MTPILVVTGFCVLIIWLIFVGCKLQTQFSNQWFIRTHKNFTVAVLHHHPNLKSYLICSSLEQSTQLLKIRTDLKTTGIIH